MYSETDLNKILLKFIHSVETEFKINSLILFGSYAEGKAKEYSDIDVAIISDDFSGNKFNDVLKLAKHVLNTSIDIEVHPYKTENFSIEDDFFVETILKTGKKII